MKRKILFLCLIVLVSVCALFINFSRLKLSDQISNESADIRGARQWELERLKDPKTGLIPKNIRTKELQFASGLPGSYQNRINSKYDFLLSNQWDVRGPSNIGGRTRAIAKDYTNNKIILAGGVSGGMWRSIDDGQSWTITTKPDQLHSSTCIAQDIRKGKENVWYFGTGELRGSSSQSSGDGIFKSTDAGKSWELLGSTSTKKPNSWENAFDYVWNIVTNPTNQNQDEVFAATAMGAIMRSTDGGASWNAVLGGLGPNRSYFTDVAISPKGVLYAALSSFAAGNSCISKGIFRSVDGVQWTDITPDNWAPETWRTVIGISPSDENQVYFLSETPKFGKLTRDFYRDSMFHSLWKYTYIKDDGKGANGIWDNRSKNLPATPDLRGQYNSQESYNMAIMVKPDDPDIVFIAGTNLYRSEDGFATDQNTKWIGGYRAGVANGYKEYLNHHPDVHTILFDYTDPNVIYTGTDGGVHKALDCTKDELEWIPLNNTYLTTQFYSVSLNHYDMNDFSVIGGMQDNCTYLTNSFKLQDAWLRLLDSDGFCCMTGGKNLYYVSKNAVYQPKIKIYKVKTDDNGNVLTTTRIDPSLGKDFIWNTPFTLDPNNSNKMYVAGGGVIWRNSDLSSIPFVDSKDSTMIGWDSLQITSTGAGSITALRVSKDPANILVFGTNKGKVYKVTNCDQANPGIVDITGSNFPASYVSNIVFNPSDASKILVSFSNYNVLSIFYTTDGGISWTPVSGNLEEFSNGSGSGPGVNWLQILPLNGGYMYFAATSTGLYATCSLDGTNTVWVQEGSAEIGNAVVDMVDVREDGYVVAGTHGVGVYSSKITSLYPLPSKTTLKSPLDGSKGFKDKVTLEWNSVSGAVFYSVQISNDPEFKSIVRQFDGVQTTQVIYDGPEQGLKNYYWRVISKNAGGSSQPSEVWSFRTAIAAPKLLSPDNASDNLPINVIIKWQKVAGATKYHILAASNISFTKKIADTILNDTSLALNNLESGKKYFWKASSVDEDGEGMLSEVFTFKIATAGGVGEIYNYDAVKVYPLPASDKLNVIMDIPGITNCIIRIINMNGQVLSIVNDSPAFKGRNEFEADVSELPSGIYYLEIVSSGRKYLKSFIIQR